MDMYFLTITRDGIKGQISWYDTYSNLFRENDLDRKFGVRFGSYEHRPYLFIASPLLLY